MATTECAAHSGLASEIEGLKESDVKQWDAIEKLQNRPPMWVVPTIGLLGTMIGFLLGIITMLNHKP